MLTSKKIDTKKTTGSDISLVVNDSKNGFAIAIDFNSQKNEALKTFLFDDSLTKKIDTVFTREIKDKKYIFQNFQVSLDGKSIYLLGKEYVQNDKSAGGRYLFEVTKITSESQKSVVIDTKEHFIGSLKTLFHNDELICLGFYSDVNDYRMKGVAYFKLEPNSLSILSSKYNPFTEQFLIDKYGKKTDKDLKFLQFRNAFFTPANDLVFNAEEVYQVNESTFSKVLINSPSFNKINNSSFTFINYNDIVCAKLNTDGDLIWARNINKKQSIVASKDESFLSYTSIFKDETCYFFVNAREKIKKLKNDRIEFEGNISRNYSNLNIIRINSNGDFDYKEILSDDENAVPFMVARGAITADNVYFLGRKGKEKQLLKVTLN
jgi:hypothetical protein